MKIKLNVWLTSRYKEFMSGVIGQSLGFGALKTFKSDFGPVPKVNYLI